MEIQYILEIFGTFSFAISGALAVNDKDQDWFGASFTGFITAIGGGSLRDMLLGSYPLIWVADITFLYAIIAGVVFTHLFYNTLHQLKKTLLLFDTLGISFFAIVGTEKAMYLGVQPEIAIIMGVFSSVMGGVIRDTLTNEIPIIFRKEIYASACLAGCTCYVVLNNFAIERTTNFLISSLLIIIIRLLAVRYNLSLPKFKRAV